MNWDEFDDEPAIGYDFFDLSSDPAEIEKRLRDFGALHAWAAQQYAKASSRYEKLFNERKRARDEKALYFSQQEDMTVADSKKAARTHHEVVDLELKMDEARERRDRFKNLLESLDATKDMLVQLSSREKMEMA